MSEHGEEAAIAAVNRVRSGGVAGFFCREEFEVIVDPDGDATAGPDDVDADDVTGSDEAKPSDDETIAEVIGRSTDDRPPPRLADVGSTIDEGAAVAASHESDPELLDRASVDEALTEDTSAADAGVEPSVFGGPVAPGADPARDRFLALLERRLDEASAAEDDLLLRRPRPASGRVPDEPLPTIPVAPAPMPAATVTRPDPPDTEDRSGSLLHDGASSRGPRPVFWHRLDLVRDELASFLPTDSRRTAVVGPLPLVSAVVTRLQSSPELASADVVVLTDRAGIVSEPTWRLERNGDRLLRAVEDADGRPLIVVIDLPGDLPSWVGPLQRRLRSAGIGLFRYALPGQPASADLERYRQGADVPYAIDLTSRVEPGLVVGLIADRHPIVSVAGADLGPELLLALRRHVGVIEPSVEPLIDG